MKEEEKVSYLMLFCALLLVKTTGVTLEESLAAVPLVGKAKHLADGLMQ